MKTPGVLRSFAVLCGIIAGVLVMEATLRLFFPQEDVHLYSVRKDGLFFNTPGFDNLYAPGPIAGIARLRRLLPLSLRPKSDQMLFNIAGSGTHVHTNSAGEWDDREHTYSRDERQRIAIIGQCYTLGIGISQINNLAHQLEKMLPNTEAINCGMQAASLGETVGIFEKHCANYKADLVVFPMFHQGSFQNIINRGGLLGADRRLILLMHKILGDEASTLISRDEDGIPYVPVNPETEAWHTKYRAYYEPRLPFYHGVHLIRFFENRWSDYRLLPKAEYHLTAFESGLYGVSNNEQLKQLVNDVQLKLLLRLQRIVHKQGAKLVLAFLPKSPKYQEKPAETEAAAEFKRKLVQLKFNVLDLNEAISQDGWSDHLEPNSNTPNEAGHRRLAEELVKEFRKRQFLPSTQ